MPTKVTSTATAAVTAASAAPTDAVQFLELLYNEQCDWNDSYYKTTTDKLLHLLGQCLQARIMLADSDKQRKNFFEAFKAINEIASSKPLSLTSRIVRFVFRITGNRASAYARVIDIATDSNIKPADLPDWVRSNGGIEELRRNYAQGQSPSAVREKRTTAACQSISAANAICVIANLPQQLHASADHDLPYTLALIRHDKAAGSGEVVWAASNETLIKQFLVHQGKSIADAVKTTASASAAQLAAESDAIDTALNAVSSDTLAAAA